MPSPRQIQIRHDVPEAEFRRVVADHVRDVAAFLSGSLAELRYEVVEFEARGDDTEIDRRVKFTSRPLGVIALEVANLDHPDSPGSFGGSVPWTFTGRSGGGYVRVLNFPGLDASTRYRVRLLVLGGV